MNHWVSQPGECRKKTETVLPSASMGSAAGGFAVSVMPVSPDTRINQSGTLAWTTIGISSPSAGSAGRPIALFRPRLVAQAWTSHAGPASAQTPSGASPASEPGKVTFASGLPAGSSRCCPPQAVAIAATNAEAARVIVLVRSNSRASFESAVSAQLEPTASQAGHLARENRPVSCRTRSPCVPRSPPVANVKSQFEPQPKGGAVGSKGRHTDSLNEG